MDPDFARQYYESASVDHWWFQGRRQLVRAYLERQGVTTGRFVDLGAGAESLLPSSLSVIKLDIVRPDAISGPFVQASAEALPFDANAFDGVGLFDVLEHLEHPERCLVEVSRVVRPGGCVLVTVPAYRWLWSPHDDLVGHQRRYTLEGLTTVLLDAGLSVEWASGFYGFLVPPAAVRSLLSLESPMAMPRKSLNEALKRVAVRSGMRALKHPSRWGLSLGAVAVVRE